MVLIGYIYFMLIRLVHARSADKHDLLYSSSKIVVIEIDLLGVGDLNK